jgi:hypothetical protein
MIALEDDKLKPELIKEKKKITASVEAEFNRKYQKSRRITPPGFF